MRSTIIFILSFPFLAQGQTNDEGVSRIVGGRDAKTREIPYIVSLQFNYRGALRHFCGGSIVHEKWILTAAHCMEFPAKEITVRAGVDNLRKNEGTSHRVAKIVIHPEYVKKSLRNDIALMELENPIKLSDTVKSVDLIHEKLPGNTKLVASGWGLTRSQSRVTPDQLQVLAETNLLDLATCKDKLKNVRPHGVFFDVGQICIFAEKGKGICQGDSGGPIAKVDSEGKHSLVGISSWNVPCARGVPDALTDVYEFNDFIKSIISPASSF